MRRLTIAGRLIDDNTPCYVIAELGGTHGGSMDEAKALIDLSVRAGVAAVKFQKRDTATLYTTALLAKPYEHEHSYGATYGAHRAALEFTPAQLARLMQHTPTTTACFATAFDERSADVLMDLGMPAIKIHSGGVTDHPLLTHVASFGRPVIVSTGGAELADIDQAHEILGTCPHAFLHCTASYPLTPEAANLRAIVTLRQRYPETVIGFSSHSPGIAFSLIAYAFGARILEHHVTRNRAGKGTDHGYALEPKGLETLIEDLGKVRLAIGDGRKRVYASERAPIAKMRRSQTPEGWKIAG